MVIMSPKNLQLSHEAVSSMISHAETGYPYEICGALLGNDKDKDRLIAETFPLANMKENQRETRYLISPDSVFLAEKEAKQKGLELLGFYHSHPDHPSMPSEYDKEHAFPWYSYLILSVEKGKFQKLTAWELKEDRSMFMPCTIKGKNDGFDEILQKSHD
jgi:proteasome lid subunit RPN8/RPN11